MNKAAITSHILDLHKGKPAVGIKVTLTSPTNEQFIANSDADGRVISWDKNLDVVDLQAGAWRVHFDIKTWFEANGRKSFYHEVMIAFIVKNTDEHYHIPLLLNSHAYSTYRGS